MGVRSEMLGLPNGNIEKVLGESKGGLSHPPAIFVFKLSNMVVKPCRLSKKRNSYNNANMRETFRMSHFARLGGSEVADTKAAFVNDKDWHYKEAAKAQENADYYAKKRRKQQTKGISHMLKICKAKHSLTKTKSETRKICRHVQQTCGNTRVGSSGKTSSSTK